MDTVRTFIAIDFPDEVVKEVARVQGVLGAQKFTGKMTELENLHLTLKFLGEIESNDIEKIRNVLRGIEVRKFEARLSEAGTFRHLGVPSIVWLKVGGKGIFELQAAVDSACEKCGFAREKRFMSHLTVVRVKYAKAKREFVEYVRKIGIRKVEWKVENFKLMKSELRPTGPVYTVIEEFGLRE